MKKHAIDYLIEFSRISQPWLQCLINEAILTNGDIPQDKLNDIYLKLKENTVNDLNILAIKSEVKKINQVSLKKITHHSGVNALKENQSIIFCPNVTILFGLNGSGKSGYFKILNEIVGGNEQKHILPKIYKEPPTPHVIDVDIYYTDNQFFKWDGQSRAIEPLNVIKVFDSLYLNGLLIKREFDSAIVQPFGLHLFSYLIAEIDRLKLLLQDEINRYNAKKQIINTDRLSPNIKSLVSGEGSVSSSLKLHIEQRYEFPENKRLELQQIEKSIQDLMQINYLDKISIETNNKKVIEALQNELTKCENLNLNIEKTKQLIDDYKLYLHKSSQFKQQVTILDSLPKTDSEIWKDFIRSGSNYSANIENSDKKCIYCNQALSTEALNLIKAYTQYLNNDSEIKLNKTKQQIEEINMEIDNSKLSIIPDEIKTILGDTNFQKIIDIEKQFIMTKSTIISNITKKEMSELVSIDVKEISKAIGLLTVEINQKILELEKDDTEKQIKIKELQLKADPLYENKSIHEQKDDFIEWMKIKDKQKNLQEILDKNLNTKKVSSLAKTASNELLTENLKNKFNEELNILGFNNIEVELIDAGVIKGKAATTLSIKGKDVKLILSEGEQKAIALSLFIAEARMQSHNSPIIFDDPINSLDHNVAKKFGQRLLELDNQIILFTHNNLFLDAFETSKNGHICKNENNGCNSKSKHIFLYQIQAEGKHKKGILQMKRADKATTYLDEARDYLTETPFMAQDEVASKIRKAVECLIDEKVFNGLIPTKYTSKNNRIHWDDFKNMNTSIELIDSLKNIYDRVSGGSLHNGRESQQNPIIKEEFEHMVAQLDKINVPNVVG